MEGTKERDVGRKTDRKEIGKEMERRSSSSIDRVGLYGQRYAGGKVGLGQRRHSWLLSFCFPFVCFTSLTSLVDV